MFKLDFESKIVICLLSCILVVITMIYVNNCMNPRVGYKNESQYIEEEKPPQFVGIVSGGSKFTETIITPDLDDKSESEINTNDSKDTTSDPTSSNIWILDEEETLKNLNVSVFSYEDQYGITAEPSYSVTWADGTYIDCETGIRKNQQGDYLCAMGTVFGECGDRFLISMIMSDGTENSFTVQIGDSKGDRWYHPYATGTEFEGYCIVEFIVDESIANLYTGYSGSYHFTDKFDGEIVMIKKIEEVK